MALTVEARIVGASGRVYLERSLAVEAPANGAAAVGNVALDLTAIAEELFFLDLRAGSAENRYLFTKGNNLQPMLTLPGTTLVTEAGADGALTITNMGSTAALFVRLDDGRELAAPGWAYFSANFFSLLPGESRTVRVEWTDGISGPVEIKAWNTGVVTIA